MTYQPKHLPPSLDYEAWPREADALPQEWNDVGPGVSRWAEAARAWDDAMYQLGTIMDGTVIALKKAYPVLRAVIRGSEANAGHDWESRSWFA